MFTRKRLTGNDLAFAILSEKLHAPINAHGFAFIKFDPNIFTAEGLTGNQQMVNESGFRSRFAFGGKIRADIAVCTLIFIGGPKEFFSSAGRHHSGAIGRNGGE